MRRRHLKRAARTVKVRAARFFFAYRAEGVRRACLRGQYSSVAPSGMGKDGEE